MKVIYYHRHARSGFHIHAYSAADIFYVPDENLILLREQHGSFGGRDYSFTDRPELLDEATTVMQGAKVEGVEISEVREFECDEARLKELIEEAKSKAKLETRVRSGIEELLKNIR